MDGHITIAERFTRTEMWRCIGDGPWAKVDLSLYGDVVPLVVLDQPITEAKETP